MILLRAYLLAGLVIHKLVWERLKRQAGGPSHPPGPVPLRVRLIKLVKMAILGAIAVQTVFPGYWLPLATAPGTLEAIGVCVFSAGLALAIAGRVQLGDNWSDIETARILPAQAVVQHGVYRYVRHPIYIGDLLLLLGLELALNSWLVLGVVALTPFVLAKAIREEEMLTASLPGYREYCQASKRFIPFVV
jgi:protein-S-isoprenylcysteine O-methyltransferase Ste14